MPVEKIPGNSRIDSLKARIDCLDGRIDGLDGKIDRLRNEIKSEFMSLNYRFDSFEKSLPVIEEITDARRNI